MVTIEIDSETVDFLNILSQQNVALPHMFKERGWDRWSEEDLRRILSKIFNATVHEKYLQSPVHSTINGGEE